MTDENKEPRTAEEKLLKAIFGVSFHAKDWEYEKPKDVLSGLMKQAIDNMTSYEKKVINLRFGLTDGITHTLGGTAALLEITRDQVRAIETRALRKLRQPSGS